MKNKLIIILLILVIIPLCHAKEGNMKLLAAITTNEGFKGSTADLKLEIVPGEGRVFIDTFPITKLDTQISTRFAKEIACDFLDRDCSNYDFIYTIRSTSSILGGPSASSAIAVLTVVLLDGLEMDNKTAITGTINSGGLIGPVGGIKAKIEAAAEENLTTVLIPAGERNVTEENETTDLFEYGKELGIKVYEIYKLEEALYYFTGESYEKDLGNISINPMYNSTMNDIADRLCSRSRIILSRIGNPENSAEFSEAINLTRKAQKSMQDKKFYSAASFCYSANVKLRYLMLKNQNLNETEIRETVFLSKNQIFEFDKNLDERKIETINDLQANMIVKERLKDAIDNLNNVFDLLEENNIDKTVYQLASGIERLYSAHSWSNFFDKGGKKFKIDIDSLKQSCTSKISEASERIEYVKLFAPHALRATREELDYAYRDKENEDYDLCLFKASKAKAEADLVISVIGVEQNKTSKLIENKLKMVKDNIIKQDLKGVFPILGYSYYEYSQSLKDSDPSSALLYVEYALELSNLDIYFKNNVSAKPKTGSSYIYKRATTHFVVGLVLGVVVTLAVSSILIKKKTKPRRKKKRKK